MSKFAWVTLTTNDTYALGSLVLAHSLRRAGTAHQLAVLVTPGVSESMRDKLKDVYNIVQEVNVMDSQDAANLALLARPELGITFTKLHCWRLVQFEKCVFLDSDTLVLQNCDELFEREELSAAPDVSWPDCFNSGVFVYKPSLDTFGKITEFALKHGSFDGGDQGLLNSYFSDWAHTDIHKHLPFVYNVTAYASYCYLPAFKQFRDKIKILHFAGKMKPWLIQFNSQSKTAYTPTDYAHASDLIQLWWNIFCDNVHQKLTEQMNFWPAIIPYTQDSQYLTNQSKNYYHELYLQQKDYFFHLQQEQEQQQQQEQEPTFQDHHHHHHYHHHEQMSIYEYDFANIKDYQDPWEDYYENINNEKNDNNNSERTEQVQHYHEEVVHQEHEKNEEYAGHVEYDAYQEHVETNESVKELCIDVTNEFESNRDIIIEQLQTVEAASEHISETQSISPILEAVTLEPRHTNHEKSKNVEPKTALNEESHLVVEVTETLDTQSATHAENGTVQNEAGLAGALSQLRLGEASTPEQDAYEQLMRRQCWESGKIDYSGKDSFDNIWKKITQTLETKPSKEDDKSENLLTSADIEDGKIEYDPKTKASTQYKLIDGGYEVHITTPQPNGTVKTQVKTFFDPKPVSDEDLVKEMANKKLVKQRLGKEVRIDKNTTMLTRAIEGGYEEVYTTINDDGTRSSRTKTFFDSVPQETNTDTNTKTDKNKTKKTVTRNSSVDSTDSTESRRVVQKVQQKNLMQNIQQDKNSKVQSQSTFEEHRRVTENVEYTENNRTVRKNSLQEKSIKSSTQSSNTNTSDNKKTKKKTKSAIPPPPPDFIENDTTTVTSSRVPGGVEYTYSTTLESGKTITTTKTVYAEEEVEMTEEEITQYKKTLKDAEKHKNVSTSKKLRSESGTKKIVPSENPGDVTTVETIKIEGGTEYHYTTVTSEGIVKKAVKTIFDPVPCNADDGTDEEEIVEEYEEEIIEPGEKNIRTIETIKQLPHKFEEEVTITHEKKEKKIKKSMMISH